MEQNRTSNRNSNQPSLLPLRGNNSLVGCYKLKRKTKSEPTFRNNYSGYIFSCEGKTIKTFNHNVVSILYAGLKISVVVHIRL